MQFRKNTVRIIRFIALLLLFFCLSTPVSADPEYHFIVSHTKVEFAVDSPPNDDWYYSELVDISIIRDKENNSIIKYRVCETDNPMRGLVYVKINGGNPMPLTFDWIDIVTPHSSGATLEFLLKPDALWQTAGRYSILFEAQGNKAADIEIVVNVEKYARISSIVPGSVHIDATDGPGRYYGSEPVAITVEANFTDWRLDLFPAGHLEYQGDSDVTIKPSELLMAINEENGPYKPFELETNRISDIGISIYPEDFAKHNNTVTTYFAADIDWHHLAGDYWGQIDVTLQTY